MENDQTFETNQKLASFSSFSMRTLRPLWTALSIPTKSASLTASSPRRFRAVESVVSLCVFGLSLAADPAVLAGATNWQFTAEASLKETFDSNIYLQDKEPDTANLAAARAAGLNPTQESRASWVTSLLPKLGLAYKPFSGLHVSGTYAPDLSFYHANSSEDYVAHRGTLNFGGAIDKTVWEFLNTATYIDASKEGPTFARPDDVPALGAIPIRDRRSAFVFRNSFRLTQPVGDFFIRPVAASYIHDFDTTLRYVPPPLRSSYVYENYIDRQEVSGGLDIGIPWASHGHVIVGYRYGRQEQFDGPFGPGGKIINSPYDNAYHRVLVGFEGRLTDWLKANVLVGPDIRDFSDEARRSYPTFQPDDLLVYLDASLTLTLSKSDSVTLRATRYEMPAFSSFSVYEDIKNDVLWRHRFNERLSSAVGFTLYIGEWQPPAQRSDWVYTPTASLTYVVHHHGSTEAAYSYEWADSHISEAIEPLTKSREYSRHLATVGLRYTF